MQNSLKSSKYAKFEKDNFLPPVAHGLSMEINKSSRNFHTIILDMHIKQM